MSNRINDDVHYNAIRKALAHGNAAVMVGAGFSRNAENGEQLAMWYDVAKELWNELNPSDDELDDFSVGMVTQLGEQYARVFSKPALEELLKRLIPDNRVRPGLLHKLLLQLPWAEIFTTNYDTLLEKSADEIVERAHYTVMCREDIPQSKILGRRRIVKLHGSFPSQRPFIFTEDDYRRYPELFSPFVNLVRQALLENVFCLVGFSGDDPNFLHWIGWVRDMLDKHALPIYLFVNRTPSLGQKTLLEARQVTPVVLPLPEGIDELDYYARYEEMLRLLAMPLEEDKLDWGKRFSLNHMPFIPKQDIGEQRKNLIEAYSSIRNLRNTYPGWLIAPMSVRNQFSRNIDRASDFFHNKTLVDNLLQETPHVGVAVLSEYAWHQEVLLQCLDDDLAVSTLPLMESTIKCQGDIFNKQRVELNYFGIESTTDFQRCWRDLGLSLLRWARQELRRKDFNALVEILNSVLFKDLQLQDEIAHESVLFSLYEGDRDIAQRLLSEWHIRSSDSYMFVRKGMLLGEIGQLEEGISISLEGLQKLRSNQDLHSGGIKYLSQEAWACLVISHLQKSKKWSLQSTEENPNDEIVTEQLSRRLADLSAKGIDSQLELQQLSAALNAETPTPSQSTSYIPNFDHSKYSSNRQIGGSQELREKIWSAFAWLTLSDRVGLVPRIDNTTFNIGSYAQAAWWVQYSDSMQRVLSVLIRSLSRDMLKPRNPSYLLHKTGWLSRYQVARTEESVALHICSQSLSLVERMLSKGSHDNNDLVRVCEFHMEVFSRLVIRINDADKVYGFMERVIALHHQLLVWHLHSFWEILALALSRCFEALPSDGREKITPLIARIPELTDLKIQDPRYGDHWISLQLLLRDKDLPERDHDLDISLSTDRTIEQLQTSDPCLERNDIFSSSPLKRAWLRLSWLKSWGLISQAQKDDIKKVLNYNTTWPVMAGHHPWATFTWLDTGEECIDQSFRHWILDQNLTCFSTPSNNTTSNSNGKRSWSMFTSNTFLESWIFSLERRRWPEEDVLSGLKIVKNWWESEWESIRKDLMALEELYSLTSQRLELFDSIIATLIEQNIMPDLHKSHDLEEWFDTVITQANEFGIEFWKMRLATSLKQSNKAELNLLEKELIEPLLNANIPKIGLSSRIISHWINSTSDKLEKPEFLVTSLSGIIASRRMPVLPWALNLVREMAIKRHEWLCEKSLFLIDSGLNKMLSELAYSDRPLGTGIPEDNIPTLRWGCARLACALANNGQKKALDSIDGWLQQASTDPLPELRFITEDSELFQEDAHKKTD